MASDAQRDAVAAAIQRAADYRTTTEPPSARFGEFTLDDGYAVGALLHGHRLGCGDRTAGLKIGLTNTAVWESLGLAEPICAPIYRSTVHENWEIDDEGIDIAGFVAPRIEPEVVLGIAENGVAWWALGFEIIDSHYPDWRMTPADAVADFGVHGALVVGDRIPIGNPADPVVPFFDVELLRDGIVRERGDTAAVLGGPLRALGYARTIVRGKSALRAIQADDVVTTGTLTPAPRVHGGETWTVRASGDASPELSLLLRPNLRSRKRLELLDVIDAVLAEKMDLLIGVRRIAALSPDLGDPWGPGFATITVVDDQTSDWIVGDGRALWSDDWLREQDGPHQAYLAAEREAIFAACQEIRAAFGD